MGVEVGDAVNVVGNNDNVGEGLINSPASLDGFNVGTAGLTGLGPSFVGDFEGMFDDDGTGTDVTSVGAFVGTVVVLGPWFIVVGGLLVVLVLGPWFIIVGGVLVVVDVVGSLVGTIDVVSDSPEGGRVTFAKKDGENDGTVTGGTGCVGLPLAAGADVASGVDVGNGLAVGKMAGFTWCWNKGNDGIKYSFVQQNAVQSWSTR